ncbi:hypothetical protein B0A52_09295 [Exophiala mesophila]|uniref:polynucleotide adenylyltransferase n=1 Tax=Exophiala mesophila TaxID=212818 RepID=A0A438MWE8_EXOME|nr:hypothetical protein B0A52_09295 [Exophiala mesophila]
MDSWRPGSDSYRGSGGYTSRHQDENLRSRGEQSSWPPSNADSGMYYFQGSRDGSRRLEPDRRFRPRHQFARRDNRDKDRQHRDRFIPYQRKVSDRPLLRINHDGPEDPSLLANTTAKFRAPDELTDSEEEEMAQSDEDDVQVPAKRPRVDAGSNDDAQVSKWSNPDPYTSLPPVKAVDAAAKRTDVLRLIRKARLESAGTSRTTAQPDDFISFDMGNGDDASDAIPPPPPPHSIAQDMPPPPPPPMSMPSVPHASSLPSVMRFQSVKSSGEMTSDLKRKRLPTHAEPPRKMHSAHSMYSDAWVQKRWIAAPGVEATPWFSGHDSSDLPGVALHKEIVEFYHWVKPREHEKQVRQDVFERLSRQFQSAMRGHLKAFGSYAAGLYLPTGDMDLVFLTRDYRPNRVPDKQEVQSSLFFFSRLLKRQIAQPGTVITISRSKVPIVKFVDATSGLKVDLCFDNDTGVNAIDTAQKWKDEFPAMPILVSIIKQFLMIRGLNDVANGGLGGFSTICLVTSLLQMYPHHQGAKSSAVNLGELLLEFFNLYGYVLDRDSVVIRLDPPAYLDKANFGHFNDKTSRLTIIDPNRADNNISGGTHRIAEIQECFRAAHQALQDRLETFHSKAEPGSFLECLVGGDFSHYESQRQLLHELYTGSVLIRPDHDARSSTRNSQTRMGRPSERAQVESKQLRGDDDSKPGSMNGDQAVGKTMSKSEKRALRLKELRPDLRPSIGKTISAVDAIKLGGYRDAIDMSKDLDARAVAAQRIQSGSKTRT